MSHKQERVKWNCSFVLHRLPISVFISFWLAHVRLPNYEVSPLAEKDFFRRDSWLISFILLTAATAITNWWDAKQTKSREKMWQRQRIALWLIAQHKFIWMTLFRLENGIFRKPTIEYTFQCFGVTKSTIQIVHCGVFHLRLIHARSTTKARHFQLLASHSTVG